MSNFCKNGKIADKGHQGDGFKFYPLNLPLEGLNDGWFTLIGQFWKFLTQKTLFEQTSKQFSAKSSLEIMIFPS